MNIAKQVLSTSNDIAKKERPMASYGPILIIDDDTRLLTLLERFLKENGLEVDRAENAETARTAMENRTYAALVVDVMMPGETGLQFTQKLRAEGFKTPILMLTAMGDVEQRIEGLSTGADDYLPKPFEPRELLARIHALLRRAPQGELGTTETIPLGRLVFDVKRGSLWRGSEEILLSTIEESLLRALAENLDAPLSREDLARHSNCLVSERTVDVQVTRLRKKIEIDPKNPKYLQTVRNIGYILRPGH